VCLFHKTSHFSLLSSCIGLTVAVPVPVPVPIPVRCVGWARVAGRGVARVRMKHASSMCAQQQLQQHLKLKRTVGGGRCGGWRADGRTPSGGGGGGGEAEEEGVIVVMFVRSFSWVGACDDACDDVCDDVDAVVWLVASSGYSTFGRRRRGRCTREETDTRMHTCTCTHHESSSLHCTFVITCTYMYVFARPDFAPSSPSCCYVRSTCSLRNTCIHLLVF
jgi:hypothetical protein